MISPAEALGRVYSRRDLYHEIIPLLGALRLSSSHLPIILKGGCPCERRALRDHEGTIHNAAACDEDSAQTEGRHFEQTEDHTSCHDPWYDSYGIWQRPDKFVLPSTSREAR